jgi:hypothetical protein
MGEVTADEAHIDGLAPVTLAEAEVALELGGQPS